MANQRIFKEKKVKSVFILKPKFGLSRSIPLGALDFSALFTQILCAKDKVEARQVCWGSVQTRTKLWQQQLRVVIYTSQNVWLDSFRVSYSVSRNISCHLIVSFLHKWDQNCYSIVDRSCKWPTRLSKISF